MTQSTENIMLDPSCILQARNITRTFREGKIATPVLKGVNLDIARGRMTAIIGKSGSGKSTLLHILGTLDNPDSGQLLFGNEDLCLLTSRQKARFRARCLGFVYQFHHLLMDFSA